MAETKRKPNPIDVHVGSRVRLRRTMQGMSQEKLGEHLGITFQQIQKYESGGNRISVSRLFAFAEALGVQPGELLPVEPLEYDASSRPIGPPPLAGPLDDDPADRAVTSGSCGPGDLSASALRLALAYDSIPSGDVKRSITTLVTAYGTNGTAFSAK